MYPRPAAPQLIGEVLDGGFRLYKATLGRVCAVALTANALGVLLYLLGGVSFDPRQIGGLPDLGAAPFAFVEGLPYILVGGLVHLIAYLVIAVVVDGFAASAPLRLGEALRWTARRLPAALLGWLLLIALCVAVVAACVLPVGLAAVLLPGLDASGQVMFGLLAALLATVAGSLCVVVVLVYAYFVPYLIVLRSEPVLRALVHSCRLVRGHWWRTLLVLTTASILYTVLAAVVVAAAGIGAALLDLSNFGGGLLGALGVALAGAAMAPLVVSVSLSLLYDLELRRGSG